MQVYTNLVEISSDVIPKDSLWIYMIPVIEESETIYGVARRQVGVVLDRSAGRVAVLRKFENYKPEGTIKFDDLGDELQKRLLRTILDVEYGLNPYNLSGVARKVRRPKEVGTYVASPRVSVQVLKDGDKFYLALDVGCEVRSAETLWDLVNKDAEKLEDFLRSNPNVKLKDAASKVDRTYRFLKIEYRSEQVIKEIYEYHKKFYPLDYLRKKFGELDPSQPVIIAEGRNREAVNLLPQLTYATYRPESVEGHAEIVRYARIGPSQKLELIRKVLEEVDAEVISGDVVRLDAVKLDDVDVGVLGVNGGEIDLKASGGNKSRKNVFKWIRSSRYQKLAPFEVAEILKKLSEILTFVIVDKRVAEKGKVREGLATLIGSLNEIREISPIPFLNFKGRWFNRWDLCDDSDLDELLDVVADAMRNRPLGFALIVLPGKIPNERFDEIKRRLFEHNVISQVVREDTFPLDAAKTDNLLLQILAKLGVKYYALRREFDYDVILGVDVTRTRSGAHIAGCTVVLDPRGYVRKIVPVELENQAGERVDFVEFFNKSVNLMERKFGVRLSNRRVLLLRDGRFVGDEVGRLGGVAARYGMRLTAIEVVKRHGFRFLSRSVSGIYARIGNDVYVLSHRVPETLGTPVPVKLGRKFETTNGNFEPSELTEKDVEDVHALTAVNYTTLYATYKLPAPVHYAHKFLDALRRGWRLDDELLREGMLYFI